MADSWLTESDVVNNNPILVNLWPGCLDHEPDALTLYLDAARVQCQAYLSNGTDEWEDPAEIPANWILAQVQQARALSMSALAQGRDALGGYGETVTIFPMDWQVKNLLRPARGLNVA